MITVGTAFFSLRLFVPGTNSPSAWTEIWKIYVFPYAHFWYLQALMLVFFTLVALEYVGLTKRVIGWCICWLGSMALLFFFPVFVGLFSFQRYLYLLPFFLFGVGIRRFPQLANNRWALWAALVVLLAGVFYQQMCWYGMLSDDPGPTSPVGLTVGMAATLLLFRVRPTWQPLVVLGGYAYGIYLLHVFGTAGSRIVLSRLGMNGSAVVFLLGLLLGILIPMGVELATKRIAWARLLIFGQKVKR
jgi:peptidoglycan/LPS O-acetylase OafA/YrhL